MSTITITLTKEQADILSNTTSVSIDSIRQQSAENRCDQVQPVLERDKQSDALIADKKRTKQIKRG
jgi:hypothetical protein